MTDTIELDDRAEEPAEPAPATPGDGGGRGGELVDLFVDGVKKYAVLYPFMLVGLVIRWLAVASWYPSCTGLRNANGPEESCLRAINWGDAFYFFTQAKLLAEGHGYAQPKAWLAHTRDITVPQYAPGAGHPPFYSTFLAVLYKLGLTTPASQRWVFPFLGMLSILLIGIAAWKIAGRHGRTVGAIAAAIAATYPIIWINDFRFLSESVYIPMVAGFLILVYRFWRTPTLRNAIYVGLILGLMSVTRGEGIFILFATMVPLLWFMKRVPARERVKQFAATAGVTFLVMVPWLVYNLSRFEEPVLITSGTGIVLIHSACDEAYDGPAAGYYSFDCADGLRAAIPPDDTYKEDKSDKVARALATDYIKANLSQLPRVALLRMGRMWYLYEPAQDAQLDSVVEGRGDAPTKIGMWYYFALLPPTVLGGFTMWRRRIPISPIVGMAVAVSFTAATTFGVTRYRIPADVGMVVMAAIGLDVAWRWVWARVQERTGGGAATAEPDATPAPA